MPIKFFFRDLFYQRFFNEPEISDSVPPGELVLGIFKSWKIKSIDLNPVWTREAWISSRARYPDNTEAN